jgi:hypothetical protein
MRWWSLVLASVIALAALGADAKPKRLRHGLSGIAKIGDRTFLGVLDRKDDDRRPRVLRVEVAQAMSQRAEALSVDWGSAGLPSDLEAVCALPGRSGEALVLESGQLGPARLIHLVGIPNAGPSGARVKGTAEVPPPPGAASQNLEGLACAAIDDGHVLVVVGERGGSPEHPHGSLRWARFDLAASALAWDEAGNRGLQLRRPEGWELDPGARAIGDLYLDGSGALWAAATTDPDGDVGPFRSAVYRAATVDPKRTRPVEIVPRPRAEWRLDGFKIEGLAAPPKAPPKAALSIATEDEEYGGAWRTLPLLPE